MSFQPLNLLSQVATNLPVLLVLVIGFFLSWRLRERAPKASLYAMGGFFLLLLLSVLTDLTGFLPLFIHTRTGMNMDRLSWVLFGVQFFLSLLTAGAWVLILLAILSDRKHAD